MRHSSRRLAPSWALLCSQISVEPYIPKGPANVKITTLYRLGPPHGHNDSCFLCYFYYVFWFVKFVHVHFICAPSRKNVFREWSTWCVSNQPGQPQKLARIWLDLTSIYSILSKQRTTKAMIRLCGWTVWSAPLVFAYVIRHAFAWPGLYRNWNSHTNFPHFLPNWL